MYVDGEDNLLVCGYTYDSVHMIRYDGRNQKILLSKYAETDKKLTIVSTR